MSSYEFEGGRALLNQAKAKVKTALGRYPAVYHAIFRFRSGHEDRLVYDDTDICIEGFPRSGNSFAVGAFRRAQEAPFKIAHHNHVPAPVLRAVQKGVPTLVLVRDPVEAVISNIALQLQNRARGKSGIWIPACRSQLQSWSAYYKRVWPLRDRIVVAPFEVVIRSYGTVIDVLNEEFGTTFTLFDHTEDNVAEIRSRGYHALPSEQRERLKSEARGRFEREMGGGDPLLQKAKNLHSRYTGHAKERHEFSALSG